MSNFADTKAAAAAKAEEYARRAGRYDTLVVANRTLASKLELFIAVAVCLLGMSGSAGYFERAAGLPELYASEGFVVGTWEVLQLSLALALGLATAYMGAVRPRDKMAAFSSASDACSAVAAVATLVGQTDMADSEHAEVANLMIAHNLVEGMLTTLEATASDNQPPLPEPKNK